MNKQEVRHLCMLYGSYRWKCMYFFQSHQVQICAHACSWSLLQSSAWWMVTAHHVKLLFMHSKHSTKSLLVSHGGGKKGAGVTWMKRCSWVSAAFTPNAGSLFKQQHSCIRSWGASQQAAGVSEVSAELSAGATARAQPECHWIPAHHQRNSSDGLRWINPIKLFPKS